MAKGLYQSTVSMDGNETQVIAPYLGTGLESASNERLYVMFVEAQVKSAAVGTCTLSETVTGKVLFIMDCSVPYNNVFRQYAVGASKGNYDGRTLPPGSMLQAQMTGDGAVDITVSYQIR